jgi:hypothetical protein
MSDYKPNRQADNLGWILVALLMLCALAGGIKAGLQ